MRLVGPPDQGKPGPSSNGLGPARTSPGGGGARTLDPCRRNWKELDLCARGHISPGLGVPSVAAATWSGSMPPISPGASTSPIVCASSGSSTSAARTPRPGSAETAGSPASSIGSTSHRLRLGHRQLTLSTSSPRLANSSCDSVPGCPGLGAPHTASSSAESRHHLSDWSRRGGPTWYMHPRTREQEPVPVCYRVKTRPYGSSHDTPQRIRTECPAALLP